MNRSACLRLTERCADILLAVRQEIKDAGDQVGEELKLPITTLGQYVSSFAFLDVASYSFQRIRVGTRLFNQGGRQTIPQTIPPTRREPQGDCRM